MSRYLNIKVADTDIDDYVPTKEVTDNLSNDIDAVNNEITEIIKDRSYKIGDILHTANDLSDNDNWLKIGTTGTTTSVKANDYPELANLLGTSQKEYVYNGNINLSDTSITGLKVLSPILKHNNRYCCIVTDSSADLKFCYCDTTDGNITKDTKWTLYRGVFDDIATGSAIVGSSAKENAKSNYIYINQNLKFATGSDGLLLFCYKRIANASGGGTVGSFLIWQHINFNSSANKGYLFSNTMGSNYTNVRDNFTVDDVADVSLEFLATDYDGVNNCFTIAAVRSNSEAVIAKANLDKTNLIGKGVMDYSIGGDKPRGKDVKVLTDGLYVLTQDSTFSNNKYTAPIVDYENLFLVWDKDFNIKQRVFPTDTPHGENISWTVTAYNDNKQYTIKGKKQSSGAAACSWIYDNKLYLLLANRNVILYTPVANLNSTDTINWTAIFIGGISNSNSPSLICGSYSNNIYSVKKDETTTGAYFKFIIYNDTVTKRYMCTSTTNDSYLATGPLSSNIIRSNTATLAICNLCDFYLIDYSISGNAITANKFNSFASLDSSNIIYSKVLTDSDDIDLPQYTSTMVPSGINVYIKAK